MYIYEYYMRRDLGSCVGVGGALRGGGIHF